MLILLGEATALNHEANIGQEVSHVVRLHPPKLT